MLEAPSISSPPKTPSLRRADIAWWAFVLIAAILLPIMIRASFDFGVTWDEKSRHKNGEMIWEYLRGLRDRSTFVEDGAELYSGMFDTICAALERYVPLNRYVFRHIVNAVFGWTGIVYCGRLAARLFGAWPGVLAMILLAASPRYFADSMNNPKDLPFAALSVMALYYISTVSPRWPYLSRATSIKVVVALALALNIRASALLYLGYLGLLVIAFVIAERTRNWRRLADTAARLAAVSVGVLLLGTTFWPWAQGSPLTRPIEAMMGFAKFPYAADMLFDGRVIASNDLPWYYAPWWFLISTPPVVLIGALMATASHRRPSATSTYVLWTIALLPLVLVIVEHSTLYDGVRHLLFIYPILVVLAASGWAAGLSQGNRPWVRISAGALLAAGLADVLVFDVKSYPNEAVYFNGIVGGPRGAFARYEMDYWGNCVLEAVAWSASAARLSGVPIAISGEPWPLIQLDSERFHELYFTLPYRGQHALDVRLAKGSREGVTGLATRPDALYKVQTPDGALLCVVVPGPMFPLLQPRLVLPAPGTPLDRH